MYTFRVKIHRNYWSFVVRTVLTFRRPGMVFMNASLSLPLFSPFDFFTSRFSFSSLVPWGNCPLNTIPFVVFMRLTNIMNFHSERLAIDAKCWAYFSSHQMSNSVYSHDDFLILKQEHVRVAHKKYMRRFFVNPSETGGPNNKFVFSIFSFFPNIWKIMLYNTSFSADSCRFDFFAILDSLLIVVSFKRPVCRF